MVVQVRFGWQATVLRAKALEGRFLSTVFWVMMAVAAVLALGVLLCSSPLGKFYDDARFAPVMMLICVQFFIAPYNTINGTILRWQMRYDLVSRISMVATVVSTGLGILMAYKGFGVYSLVVSGILSSVLLTSIMAFYAPWRPKLTFSWNQLRPHFTFSWRLHLNNSINLLSNRIDNILIGKLVNVQSLGIYVKAFSLGRMPINLLGANLYQLFYTALSHIRENRQDSISLFQKMLGVVTFAVYLPLLLLILLGEGFVVNLYGEKWAEAVLPMQIMAVGSFAGVANMLCGAFADAQNLVAKETQVQTVNLLLTVTAVLIGSRWGLIGIATGISMKVVVMQVMMYRLLNRGIGFSWRDLLHPVWPQLAASACGLGAGISAISFWGKSYEPRNLAEICLVGATACTAYIGCWVTLAVMLPKHGPMRTIWRFLRTILSKVTIYKLKNYA